MFTPRYPNVEVQLVGQDGNAISMIGRTRRALRKAGVDRKEIDLFADQALSGDYDKVLSTIRKWVNVS